MMKKKRKHVFFSHMIIMVNILLYSLSDMAKYNTASLDCFVGKSISEIIAGLASSQLPWASAVVFASVC